MIEERAASKRAKAVAAVALLAVAAIGGALMVDEGAGFSEPADAIVITASMLAVMLIAAIVVAIIGWAMYFYKDVSAGADEWARNEEAKTVASSIALGLAYYKNALDNYAQIWGLTDEHFIRTAEIAASAAWQKGKAYSPEEILEDAGVYLNGSYMLANAAAQTSAHFHSLDERLHLWNGLDAYRGKMDLSWVYGQQSFGSKSDFDGWLTGVATPTAGHDKVYLSGNTHTAGDGSGVDHVDFWSLGGPATLTKTGGGTVSLPTGPTDLDTVPGFEPGVYTLPPGTYAGQFTHIIDPAAAPITSGIVMKAGSAYRLASLGADRKIYVDGGRFDSLSVRISPDGGTPQETDVSSALGKLRQMQLAVGSTASSSSSSAAAVWSIFGKAGAASEYLTTLAVPDSYQDIAVNEAQKELITIMAMAQLADYWSSGRDKISAGDFKLSSDSLQLFVRGDLVDKDGTILHKDAIFTPFYYGSDLDLSKGPNQNTQTAIVAIWDKGPALSSWSFTSSTAVASLQAMQSGTSVYAYEIMYGGQMVDSVHLDIRGIDIIDPEKIQIVIVDPPPKKDDPWGLVSMILLALGIVAVASFPLHRRVMLIAGGAVCIGAGLLIPIVTGNPLLGIALGAV
ncbi:MAG: hypothetical protein LBG62_00075 [Candidatus Methanoplasma sp.]|jgi:hypothetical protein|nr:hypothetical protein [Candidatus Methanoplasma sp.]